MENLEFCPICNNKGFIEVLKLKDYFFTKQDFTIQKCAACGFKLTNPRPTQNEIGKYYESENYLSHRKGKETLFAKAYNLVRDINITKKGNIIEANSSGKTVLDIGCGVGLLLKEMKRRGWAISGVEPGREAKLSAETILGIPIHDDINSVLSQKYDVITMWHVLEHIPEIREHFKKINLLLKNNGTLILAVPNASSPESAIYGKYWAAYDVPRHFWHFRPTDIDKLCQMEGFKVVRTLPMWFDSFYICLLSEKYRGQTLGPAWGMLNALRTSMLTIYNKTNCSSLIYIIKRL